MEVVVDVVARGLVDGGQLGTGRRVIGSLRAGTHRLRVEAAGRLPYQSTIAVQAYNRTQLEVTLGVDPETLTELGAWPTVALIATTSAFTLGLVAGGIALASNGTYQAALDDYNLDRAAERLRGPPHDAHADPRSTGSRTYCGSRRSRSA